MDRRKMRYKDAIQHVNSNYYQETWMNHDIMEHLEESDEKYRYIYQEKLNHASKIIRTSLPLMNLTVPNPFQIQLSELPGVNTEPLTKEEHVENIDVMIAERERLLQGIKNLYKGTAKKSEDDVSKQIEGLKWCREKILEGFIVL